MKIQIQSDNVKLKTLFQKLHKSCDKSCKFPIDFCGYKLFLTDFKIVQDIKNGITTLEIKKGILI